MRTVINAGKLMDVVMESGALVKMLKAVKKREEVTVAPFEMVREFLIGKAEEFLCEGGGVLCEKVKRLWLCQRRKRSFNEFEKMIGFLFLNRKEVLKVAYSLDGRYGTIILPTMPTDLDFSQRLQRSGLVVIPEKRLISPMDFHAEVEDWEDRAEVNIVERHTVELTF